MVPQNLLGHGAIHVLERPVDIFQANAVPSAFHEAQLIPSFRTDHVDLERGTAKMPQDTVYNAEIVRYRYPEELQLRRQTTSHSPTRM